MTQNSATLSDLTLIIPSYERQAYLLRQIEFWSRYPVNVVILDGSKSECKHSCIVNTPSQIKYRHMPVSLEERLGFVRGRITTKFAALLSDDEFLIPSAVESCLEYLLSHPEYAACKGQALWFDCNKGAVVGGRVYPGLQGYVIDDDTASGRMLQHMRNYEMATLWSIQRTDVFNLCLEVMSSERAFSTAAAAEMQISLATAYSGKCKVINELMWLRSRENENIWWSFGRQSIVDWFREKENGSEHQRFFSALSNVLSNNTHQSNITAELHDAVEAYVMHQEELAKTFKEKFKSFIKTTLGPEKTAFLRANFKKKRALQDEALHLRASDIVVDYPAVQSIVGHVRKFHSDRKQRE